MIRVNLVIKKKGDSLYLKFATSILITLEKIYSFFPFGEWRHRRHWCDYHYVCVCAQVLIVRWIRLMNSIITNVFESHPPISRFICLFLLFLRPTDSMRFFPIGSINSASVRGEVFNKYRKNEFNRNIISKSPTNSIENFKKTKSD